MDIVVKHNLPYSVIENPPLLLFIIFKSFQDILLFAHWHTSRIDPKKCGPFHCVSVHWQIQNRHIPHLAIIVQCCCCCCILSIIIIINIVSLSRCQLLLHSAISSSPIHTFPRFSESQTMTFLRMQ